MKTKQSLSDKLSRSGGKYERLEDVTDLCGVRVITYFPDEVDQVASVIEREFDVDRVNSIDKRAALDPDRFGYLSLHHVVRLIPDRAKLGEYKKFAGCVSEIQTRSILQHAWAEIEHDLGYKTGLDVPRGLRRRFARLAGLLEAADEEFARIRDGLKQYEASVAQEIAAAPGQVTLDKVSLMAFVRGSEVIRALDTAIAGFAQAELREEGTGFLTDAQRFTRFGVSTIADLEVAVQQRRPVVERFAQVWLEGSKHEWVGSGISLFYLWYVLVAETNDPVLVREQLESNTVGPAEERDEMVVDILEAHRRSVKGGPG